MTKTHKERGELRRVAEAEGLENVRIEQHKRHNKMYATYRGHPLYFTLSRSPGNNMHQLVYKRADIRKAIRQIEEKEKQCLVK